MENFLTNIHVNQARNVKNLDIPLSSEKRQHLIITGKNGSGKTSLLIEISKFLRQIQQGSILKYKSQLKSIHNIQYKRDALDEDDKIRTGKTAKGLQDIIKQYGGTILTFSSSYEKIFKQYEEGKYLLKFFDAQRKGDLRNPTGIAKIPENKVYRIEQNFNVEFIQYLVNLKADRSFAKDDNELDKVKEIDLWFKEFEDRLKYILDAKTLLLKFNRRKYNFDIIIDDSEPVDFNSLSDGYSAILSIISELIIRLTSFDGKGYKSEGLVLIDEIETHLHVDLQKKILPFLTDFFPKIQFIVSTHSPFVLSSVSNAVICDLENRIITEDLSNYSYDALIESYFGTDKYSELIKAKIIEFEGLIDNTELTEENFLRLKELRNYFTHSPKYLSNELAVKLQELELKEIFKNRKK